MTITTFNADHFDDVFPTVKRSSWRWECQGHYAVDEHDLQEWREGRGERGDADDLAWRAYIQGLVARGIPFERVRLVPDPITEYIRYQLDTTDWNIDSGEDIRWIEQHTARELGMPTYDFYLFDDNRVGIFRFDENMVLLGIDVDDDPEVLLYHQGLRDRVWPIAIPHTDYRTSP